ncbi:hypothetical protein ACT3UD_18235 [Glutamicibacter sp. 287]|uniref:hypothetical protein n=1 Tax=unclassified Glutamicibacter TaxID=2627139 RepID=UPI004034D84B
MSKVERILIVDGGHCEVSHALRADKSVPAAEFLEALSRQNWPIEDIELPDEKQPSFRSRMLACLRDIAEGYDILIKDHNKLVDGIWELKADVLRLTFYDTDGAGKYTPKEGSRVPPIQGNGWILDVTELDEYVRTGHAFSKSSQKTSRADLDEAIMVRKEDLHHDCN